MLPGPHAVPARPRGGLGAKLALAAASIVLTVAAAETITRVWGKAIPVFLIPSPTNCLRRSASLGMDFRPECTGIMDGAAFRTNALGLRGPEVVDDDRVRILAAGDSCTFGWAVAESEAYPARLERVLDEHAGGRRYQVINAGVPGYTSYQGLVYLRERGLTLRPKLVLIDYGFNDTFRTGDVEQQLARARLTTPFLVLDDTLIDYSRLYRWLRWQGVAKDDDNLPVRVSGEQYERNLRAMIEAARAAGAKVVVLSFWSLIGSQQKDYREALNAATQDTDTPVVWYRGPKLDLVHPTAAGYGTLTDNIAAQLQESGFVQPAESGQNAT
jgi:lysophospholipase L1-like esterase